MKLRHISPSTVRRILKKPDEIIQQKGKKVYQSIIRVDGTPKHLIRIFVNTEKNPNLIITVYMTSKIAKYYEGKI